MGAFGKDLFSIGKPSGYWIIPFAMYVCYFKELQNHANKVLGLLAYSYPSHSGSSGSWPDRDPDLRRR